ncbi:hypothetical protein [uncultured Actinomyces sp.]|uniref:hypothetical protein n=1 Tax=uncultured Actinomyces sp. TaxID=249061 RepID=UPI0028DBFB8F|nr:hypothetical protein [uncultured Actinomyces sp.]
MAGADQPGVAGGLAPGPVPAGGASDTGGTAGGRARRRVVALCAADLARIARGELPAQQAEEERRRSVDALTDACGRSGPLGRPGTTGDANDARLLAEVPPHWQ